MLRCCLFVGLTCLLLARPVYCQGRTDKVQSLETKIEPASAKPGQTVFYRITVKLAPNHYTYPTVQPDAQEGDSVNLLHPPEGSDLIFVEPITNPPGAKSKPGIKGTLAIYPDEATYAFTAVVSPLATPGEKKIKLKRVRFTVCNDETCVPVNLPVEASFTVAGEPVKVDDKYRSAVEAAISARAVAPPTPLPPKDPPVPVKAMPPASSKPVMLIASPDYSESLMSVLDSPVPVETAAGTDSNKGFGTFLLTAALWGIITLLTPCVFPMVPITVSVFLKQSEKQGTSPVRQAAVYSLTIVAVLGVSALTLLGVFRDLSINPWMNIGLGLLFVVFALSLFGMYDITLPRGLVNYTSSREGAGYLGTVFMGLTFSLISFTCVAPFLGGFAGMSASGNFSWPQLAAGAFVFAASFAAPFFVLALFPSLLKKVPKSGGWLNTIKVVMGFLEFAAALKFFRTAELRWLDQPVVFAYDIVLALWIGSLVAMGLYLFGLFRLPHDHGGHGHVGVPRMLSGLLALGVAVYLTPALFSTGEHRNRPGGTLYAWVDAFLLPEPGNKGQSGDLKRSLEVAHERDERVFVDFTGVTCTNCKLNEENVFPKPNIRALLERYRSVQLYTDDVPSSLYETAPGGDKRYDDAQANLNFQRTYFGTEQLPLYAILKPLPGGKAMVLAVYAEGKINNEAAFIEFLKNGLR
jgi:thiol:disulfide interchange protein DsbD